MATFPRTLDRRTVLLCGDGCVLDGAVATRLMAHGACVTVVPSRSAEGIGATVADLLRSRGSIDVLVNCVGDPTAASVSEAEPAEWELLVAAYLKGVYRACHSVMPQLVARRQGSVVNVTAISGLIGIAGQSAGSVISAGVIGLTRTLALEAAPAGVRVNCVSVDIRSHDSSANRSRPIGRSVQPEEVAAVVAFVASQEASFMTGTVVPVDGGLIAR